MRTRIIDLRALFHFVLLLTHFALTSGMSAIALLLCWPFGGLALMLTLVARAKAARPNASEAVRMEAIKLYMLAYRMAICGIMFGCVNLILLFAIDPARLERDRRELELKSG